MNATDQRSSLGSTSLSEDERIAFGNRLAAARLKTKKSQADFAPLVGINKETVRRYEAGDRLPDVEGLIAWSAATGVTVAELVTPGVFSVPHHSSVALAMDASLGYGSDDKYPPTPGIVWVPRYDIKAAAGRGYFNETEDLVEKLAFRAWWVVEELEVEPEGLFLCNVVGDSMTPLMSHGDTVMGNKRITSFIGDKVYLLRLHGGLLIKQLQRTGDGMLRVVSRNPAYREEMIPEDAVEKGVDFQIIAEILGKPEFVRF